MADRSIGDEKTIGRERESGGFTLSAGQVLGQYRIIRALGRGGMGEVYEVEHQVLRRRYALKLLPADFAGQSGALARFEREAQVMANLEHQNIIRVDEFGETGGRYWLRMELAQGADTGNLKLETGGIQGSGFRVQGSAVEEDQGQKAVVSLQDLADARGGRIPQEELVGILKQILEGLAYAHGHGAIHRDLKPSNILLFSGRDGAPRRPGSENRGGSGGPALPEANDKPIQIKIADFGLVRLVGEEWVRSQAQLSVQRSMSMGDLKTLQKEGEGTSTKSLLGTYEYMSPEQKRGEEATERSDLYAVGLMAYRLLTGRGLSMKRPSEIDKALAKEWDAFLAEALEEEAAERWSDAKAMRGALDNIETALRKKIEDARKADAEHRAKAEAEKQARVQEEAKRLADQIRRREEEERRAAAEAEAEAKRKAEQARQAAQKSPLKPPEKTEGSKVWVGVRVALAVVGAVIWAANQGDWPVVVAPRSQPRVPNLDSSFTNSLGMELVPVSGLDGVLFCKWETRVQDYEAFVRERPREWPKPSFAQGPMHPAVNVAWNNAVAFCEWLTEKERREGKIASDQRYRLPKDWEWSVAVGLNESRGGSPRDKGEKTPNVYPWNGGRGTWPPPRGAGNYSQSLNVDSFERTSPVGSFDAQANGLYDMGGNVWEWCDDFYDGRSGWGVLRGGSWRGDSSRALLSSCRNGFVPVNLYDNYGFRVVLSR